MTNSMKLSLAGLVGFLTGCTASGPPFSPAATLDANKAVVYIYRPFDIIGSARSPHVYIDEVKYGSLKNNGYLVYFVEPGKRIIRLSYGAWDKPMRIYPDLEAGKEYYFRLTYKSEIGSIVTQFGMIPEEHAKQEIAPTKRAE